MSEGVLFYAEQDVQQGAADPGVGKLSGFQKIAEGTPGSKIISLIDDSVGEVFADIKIIGQRGRLSQSSRYFSRSEKSSWVTGSEDW